MERVPSGGSPQGNFERAYLGTRESTIKAKHEKTSTKTNSLISEREAPRAGEERSQFATLSPRIFNKRNAEKLERRLGEIGGGRGAPGVRERTALVVAGRNTN